MKFQFYLSIFFILSFLSCENLEKQNLNLETNIEIDTLVFALDWSPNIAHAGFFWAEAQGMFAAENLYIEWFSPEIDNYKKSPINKVVFGGADIGISNTEQLLIFGADCEGRINAKALATFIQNDSRVFISKKTTNDVIQPKFFDGKKYFYFFTPIEKEIIESMCINDGGIGNIEMKYTQRLNVWEDFYNDSVEIAWVNTHWEAAKAEYIGLELYTFQPKDFGVPYGYSSLLVTSTEHTPKTEKAIERFVKVLEKAHTDLVKNESKEVAEILCRHVNHPNFEDEKFIALAFEKIKPNFLSTSNYRWGLMNEKVWEDYYLWMKEIFGEKSEIVHFVQIKELYTNELLSFE